MILAPAGCSYRSRDPETSDGGGPMFLAPAPRNQLRPVAMTCPNFHPIPKNQERKNKTKQNKKQL